MNQPFCFAGASFADFTNAASRAGNPVFGETFNFAFTNNLPATTSLVLANQPMAIGGTIRNLKVTLDGTSGGTTRYLSLFKNDADTGYGISLGPSDTEQINTGSVSLAADDFCRWQYGDTGTVTTRNLWLSFEFDAGDLYTSIYPCSGPVTNVTQGTTVVHDAGLRGGQWGANTTAGTLGSDSIVGCAGTVTALCMRWNPAPGAGNSRTVALVKNSVVQDGSGGTVDTRCVVSGTSLQTRVTFSLSVSPLDTLRVTQTTTSGTPVAARSAGTIAFVATNPGEFNMNGNFLDTIGTNATHWIAPLGRSNNRLWNNASETLSQARGTVTPFRLRGLYVSFTSTISSAGEGAIVTLRKNGADSSQSVTVMSPNMAGLVATDSPVDITSSDLFSMQWNAVGTPTGASQPRWSFTALDPKSVPVGSVFSSGGTLGRGVFG